MYTKLVKLWTDALRSGEFKKTTGTLQDADGYCCLGVLCEVMLRNNLVPSGMQIRKGKGILEVVNLDEDSQPRWEESSCDDLMNVQDLIRLPDEVRENAVGMNDSGEGEDNSFLAIAAYLESALTLNPLETKENLP